MSTTRTAPLETLTGVHLRDGWHELPSVEATTGELHRLLMAPADQVRTSDGEAHTILDLLRDRR